MEADSVNLRERADVADPARPRRRRAGDAAAPGRPAVHRRGVLRPPARRPLPGPVRLLRAAEVPPEGPGAADPGLGPARHRGPDGARLRPAGEPRDDRESSTSRSTPTVGRSRSGRSGWSRCPSSTRCRRTPCASTPTTRCSSTPATAASARRSSEAAHGRPTCCRPRRRSWRRRRDTPPDLHLTGTDVGRDRPPAPCARPVVLTHIPAVARPRGRAAPRPARRTGGRLDVAGTGGARRTTSEGSGAVPPGRSPGRATPPRGGDGRLRNR